MSSSAWGTDFTAARTTLEGWNVDTENPTRPSTALFPSRIQRPISDRILTQCRRLDRDVDYDRLISAWSADLNLRQVDFMFGLVIVESFAESVSC
jgi:hypothetical protein